MKPNDTNSLTVILEIVMIIVAKVFLKDSFDVAQSSATIGVGAAMFGYTTSEKCDRRRTYEFCH